MKEAIYDWMKCLAVFYILLSTILHLVPTGQYERYVRFFMGLLLIFMLCTPVFSILGKSGEITKSFQEFYQTEENYRQEQELENLQELYLKKGYEEEIGKKILENLQEKGIDALQVEVNIEGEKLRVTVWMREKADEEQERGIQDELREEWGVAEGDSQIAAAQDEQQAVGHSSSAGTASGGDRTSNIG